MSDTPLTDVAEFCSEGPRGYGLMMVVSSATSRGLERKMNELKALLIEAYEGAMDHDIDSADLDRKIEEAIPELKRKE